jgi:hypothetical protein
LIARPSDDGGDVGIGSSGISFGGGGATGGSPDIGGSLGSSLGGTGSSFGGGGATGGSPDIGGSLGSSLGGIGSPFGGAGGGGTVISRVVSGALDDSIAKAPVANANKNGTVSNGISFIIFFSLI